MTKDWAPLQEEIRSLYHVDGKPLSEVMRLMRGRHSFIASERSYRTQLQKWGYMKYSTQANPKPNPRPNLTKRRINRSTLPKGSSVSIPRSEPSLSATLSTFPLEAAGEDGYLLADTADPHFTNLGHNQQDVDGKTQLHRAVISMDMNQVQTLLFAGAAVNIKDYSGYEPIHYSVVAGGTSILEQLLQFGADVNVHGPLGRSPLHLAASSAFALFDVMVKAGANLSIQDENGDTPLHLAISAAFDATRAISTSNLKTIIQSGCDVNLANIIGVTPFLALLDRSYSEKNVLDAIHSCLLRGGSTTKSLPNGTTPLQIFLSRSATEGHRWAKLRQSYNSEVYLEGDILKTFLLNGASVTTPMPSGEPLFVYFFNTFDPSSRTFYYPYQADGRKHAEIVKMFFRLSPPNQAGRNGNCVLHILAAAGGSMFREPAMEELIQLQLQNGANPNAGNQDGKAPLVVLIKSSRDNNATILRTMAPLLKHGADPWQQDSLGTCALFEAAKRTPKGRGDILRALLEADLHHIDTRGRNNELRGRFCWKDWQNATQSTDWNESKDHILDQFSPLPSKFDKAVRDAALSVLAGKHICLSKDKFKGDATEKESRHSYVSGILRDCRARDVFIDMKWFDYLLGLCIAG